MPDTLTPTAETGTGIALAATFRVDAGQLVDDLTAAGNVVDLPGEHRSRFLAYRLDVDLDAVNAVANGTTDLGYLLTAYEPGTGDDLAGVNLGDLRITGPSPEALADDLDELAAMALHRDRAVLLGFGVRLSASSPGEAHAALSRLAQAVRDRGYTYTVEDARIAALRGRVRDRFVEAGLTEPEVDRKLYGPSTCDHGHRHAGACPACLDQLAADAAVASVNAEQQD